MGDLEARKRRAAGIIDRLSGELREVSLAIHGKPELNFEEHHAHAVLTQFLEGKGFDVRRSAFGLATAFQAVAGQGSPTLAVMCEYDALPGIGHACGHNLIAISGLAAGIALKETLKPGEGSVVVLGSPAEEGGHGKVYLIEEGAFDRVDAAMMLHPAPGDVPWSNVMAIHEVRVEYRGRAAHAAASPWDGLNALDAVLLAFTGINALRQQIRTTDRIHGVITDGGLKPNIIPDFAAADFYVRSKNLAQLEDLKRRVLACFEAAATATGCDLAVRWAPHATSDLRNNDVMAASYAENLRALGVVTPTKERCLTFPGGSTDMGNVSYVVPSIHPHYGIPAKAGNHNAGFTEAAATVEAHQNTLRAAKAMAWTALQLYLEPGTLDRARAEFRAAQA